MLHLLLQWQIRGSWSMRSWLEQIVLSRASLFAGSAPQAAVGSLAFCRKAPFLSLRLRALGAVSQGSNDWWVCDILTAGLTLYTTPFVKQLMFWACLFVEDKLFQNKKKPVGDLFIFCDFYLLLFLRISLVKLVLVFGCCSVFSHRLCPKLSVSDSLARHKSRVMPPQCLTACFSNAVEPNCHGQISKSSA